ncbi:hypothetical protein P3X46_033338 [Hevea brasiliensis]|uniref:Uncharacterized protein n=1 Tax=Hevea brasiliensis TaxID=3981 RepID=A0ABQ9KHC3_HEVBR|nr:hypothetical protein P3X46_033338 [Hevea brasiliensis]
MSLRYMSRVVFQAGMRVVQGMKDQTFKCDSTVKSLKDSVYSSSSKQIRRFSGAVNSGDFKAAKKDQKLKQAEESLRTVMYLSCWGPN